MREIKVNILADALLRLSGKPLYPSSPGVATKVGAGFLYGQPVLLTNLLREHGDSHHGMPLTDYFKMLDRLEFEQFADFPTPGGYGRSLAFLRKKGLVLASLNIEKDSGVDLTCTARHLPSGGVQQPFDEHSAARRVTKELISLNSKSSRGRAWKANMDCSEGFTVKLHALDVTCQILDKWWGLDDAGNKNPNLHIGYDLVTMRDRSQCSDYFEVKRLEEERQRAIPSGIRDIFDADAKRKFEDVIDHPIVDCGRGH